MRLKPHTYRRLAWVACWAKDFTFLDLFELSRPEDHELQCLHNLLSLYKVFQEQYPDVDFTAKTAENTEIWKRLCKDEDESIQTLTILFPSQRSLATFLCQIGPIFYISEITKYCADGTVNDYKGHLLQAMRACFGGPSRSFSPDLPCALANFYFLCCVKGHNFKSASIHSIEYCDLYRDLYSNEFPDCPEKSEIRRRMRISKTKRSKNRESISLRKMHVSKRLVSRIFYW